MQYDMQEVREVLPIHVLVDRVGMAISSIESVLSGSGEAKDSFAERPMTSIETKIDSISSELEKCELRLKEIRQRLYNNLERM